MNKKQILVVVGALCFIAGFILFTPPGVMLVVMMVVLMMGVLPTLLQDVYFILMVIAFFSMATLVVYLMFRNLRTINPQ